MSAAPPSCASGSIAASLVFERVVSEPSEYDADVAAVLEGRTQGSPLLRGDSVHELWLDGGQCIAVLSEDAVGRVSRWSSGLASASFRGALVVRADGVAPALIAIEGRFEETALRWPCDEAAFAQLCAAR